MRTSLALLVCVFSMVGCGGYVPAPLHPSERDFQRELGPAPEGIADDPAEAMTLYAGDVLTVRTVSSETQEILGIVVDAAGRIHVPLAGDVEVGGLTLGTAPPLPFTCRRRRNPPAGSLPSTHGHRA